METPSFTDAVRWNVDQDKIRLRMSDRAVARLPAVARRVADRVLDTPRGSRQRRWLLNRMMVAGWVAYDSRNYGYLERLFSRTVRYEVRAELLEVTGAYEGWDEVLRMFQSFNEVASGLNTRLVEIIDLGGRFVASRAELTGTGRHSGIAMARDLVQLYEIESGQVDRQWTTDGEEAAEGALAERLAELGAAQK